MFARVFIDRPVLAWVISVVIVLFGGAALTQLPIAQYPEIAPPTVTVSCVYPGANATVVSNTVAAPLEQQINGVANMLYMSSSCGNDGSYSLTITFALGTDLNVAQVLVHEPVGDRPLPLPPHHPTRTVGCGGDQVVGGEVQVQGQRRQQLRPVEHELRSRALRVWILIAGSGCITGPPRWVAGVRWRVVLGWIVVGSRWRWGEPVR